ncbi:NACHT domain-containing protein [Prosthecobacter debontii]|uniref:NACHT domain-containing protein n=1 Tax=Prosthecobacter debontii TaxID=48467 RepID=A0A1T4XZT8_9BACT|nr:NACHT domain-containing protein [Prosthecobacter debontii]SKA95036.1 NACHT domain-containing protein [Prosthecobacter debontii]
MADPATSSFLTGAASKLGSFVWDQLTKAAPDLLKKFKEKRAMEQAVENYLSRYMDAYGSIKPIGMTHAIPLEQIYTEVQLTTEDLRLHFSEKMIEKTALSELRRTLNERQIRKQDGIDAANQFQRMLVVGNPGGGKSIYLQRIGWECLRSHGIRAQGHSGEPRYQPELLPVLLELKRCRSDEKASLVELLAREFADCGFPESVPMVEALLKAGKLLVLLDALDEVAQDRVEAVVQDAQSMVRRYPECRFIISCRIAFRHDYFRDFKDVTLLEFSDEQISRFIHNWFCDAEQKEAKIALSFVRELHRPEHKATLELARSPVLLGYLCVGYQGSLQLSSNRAEIYRRALDIFLQEWNARNLKTAHIRQLHASLPADTELLMLAQIAYRAMQEERFFLTRDEWIREIREFMTDLVEKPKTLPVGDILDGIAVSQGLVVQRSHQDWSFSHLTLQEYLAAYHIDQNGLMEITIRNYLGEKRWEEVFLILAGMKPGILLQEMIVTANAKIHDKNPSWTHWRDRLNAWDVDGDPEWSLERLAITKLIGASIYQMVKIAGPDTLDFAMSQDRALFLHSALESARDLAIVCDRTLVRDLSRVLDIERALSLNAGLDDIKSFAHAQGVLDNQEARLKKHALERAILRTRSLARVLANEFIRLLDSLTWVSQTIRDDLMHLEASSELINGEKDSLEGLLPPLESPSAFNRYFSTFLLIHRCKKAGAHKLKASEWQKVLEQIF